VAAVSAYVLAPGGGRSFDPGINVKVEHGASGDFAMFESALPPSLDGPPPHVHRIYDEAFYVLDGSVTFNLDGQIRDCPAGSCVFIPRGVSHGFDNPADTPAKILVITTPEAIRLVEDIYTLMGEGDAQDPEAMAALYVRHQSEIAFADRS
jgi:mannose-6-phosphate isomerase-like protein (cupin superfamily)